MPPHRLLGTVGCLLLLLLTQTGQSQELKVPKQLDAAHLVLNETVTLTLPVTNDRYELVHIIGVEDQYGNALVWHGTSMLNTRREEKLYVEYRSRTGEVSDSIIIITPMARQAIPLKGKAVPLSVSTGGDGRTLMYLSDGKKMMVTTFTKPMKNGEPQFAHLQSYERFHINGKRHVAAEPLGGSWAVNTFHPNGKKASTGAWKLNGGELVKDGEWVFWHPNGAVSAKGKYSSGIRTGFWQTWHDNGAEHEKIRYQMAFGWKTFNSAEKAAAKLEGTTLKGGLTVGSYPLWYESFYANGEKKFDVTYINRKEYNGMFTAFYPDGSLNSQKFIKRNKQTIERLFCPDGTAIIDKNLHRKKDERHPNPAEACPAPQNLLLYLPRLSSGSLFYQPRNSK